MSDFVPTPSQKEAIEARGGALLVSAGAGSGKTKVLTERLMRYILNRDHPQSITDFVVITFTKASAAELLSRITAELSRAEADLSEDPSIPPAFLEHVRCQQVLCHKAQIGTIHHFCTSVLREFGHQLGLVSDFSIITDELAQSMKEEALNRVLDARYRDMQAYPGFESLVNSVGTGRNDDRLFALVLSLYAKMQCHPRPDRWAEACVTALTKEYPDVGSTPWGEEILSFARSEADYWVHELGRLMALIAEDEVVSKAYFDGISQGADAVRELARCLRRGWEAARQCPPVAFGRLSGVKKDHNPALAELVKSRRDACKKAMDKIAAMFYADSESISAELQKTAPSMQALLQLTFDFEKQYASSKLADALLDYSDLEHYAAALLTEEDGSPTPLALSVGSRYTEVMVDEYQDVSRVQEAVFTAVSGGGSRLFMVGDVKQAIYRFRLADPEIFNEKYRSYPLKSAARPGEPGKILLRENFRSRREVLSAANAVFSCCMTEQLGDVAYDDAASLIFGAKGYAGSVPLPEVHLLSLPEADENGFVPDKTVYEAECTAEKILALMRSGTTVAAPEGERELRFGDIALLLRNANTVGGIYSRVFAERGIPVAGAFNSTLFDTREGSFVFSMLQIMDNPYNEVALLSVLASPAIGFSGDELAAIRAADKESGFYAALKLYSAQNPKARQFLALLDAFRSAAPDLTAEKIIRMILYRTDILAVCSAMPDSERRLSNLMQMLTLATRFEKNGTHGLHRFVRYLEKQKKKESSLPTREGEGSAVQLMSIHYAKGLEFPVVFLCDTARRFNLQDTLEPVLVHPELGLGPKLVDNKLLVQYPTLARKAIALRIRRETLSEELRLLYVAFTRARERLYISAVVDDAEAFLEKQKSFAPLPGERAEPEALASAHTPIEWITIAALADRSANLSLSCDSPQPLFEPEAPSEQQFTASEAEVLALSRSLSWSYPDPLSSTLPSKVTATELKNLKPSEDPESLLLVSSSSSKRSFRVPDFTLADKQFTATERGIATHLALQYIDLSFASDPEGVRREVARLETQKFLSPRQASAVNQSAIVRLFRSDLGHRILTAEKLHREFRFSLLCTGRELLNIPSDEKILLQGVVDCCLEFPDGLVIIDYKTDFVRTDEDISLKCEHYSSQIRAYSLALSRIFRKPVKETIFYFLSCDRAAVTSSNNREQN
ncbi:MAG: UvrD-helicase domain-containing protein [Oscillospiraceae bacterium]|nr:UvrD-helicase domain-containing protein [Oscillospiraceae bacterium]